MRAIFLPLTGLMMIAFAASAQRPTHIQLDNEPLRPFESPVNIVVYIVIPLLIMILYLVWKKKNRNKQPPGKENQ